LLLGAVKEAPSMQSDKGRARWRIVATLAVSLSAIIATHATASGPSSAAPAKPQSDDLGGSQPFLGGWVGAKLVSLDGSTVSLTAKEGGVVRTITSPEGAVKTMAFIFLGQNLGTVSETDDQSRVSGVFHVAAGGIAVDYADGRSEFLAARGADGLTMSVKSADGDYACAAWYLPSHVFTADEKRAAVAAYARRLGVANGPDASHADCANSAAVFDDKDRAAEPSVSVHRKPTHAPREAAARVAPQPSVTAKLAGLQTVPVKQSTVHLIDAAPTQPATDNVGAPPVDERIASNCLKVESDGNYWGFRNHCSYNVQFAYCLLHGSDEMTACTADGLASVSGSVSSNGFGPLFADASPGERDVEHQFRWVGCRGGAGEVIARLDQSEPASGRCVRNARTLARDY
jgi:hypothetical protein